MYLKTIDTSSATAKSTFHLFLILLKDRFYLVGKNTVLTKYYILYLESKIIILIVVQLS